LEKDIQNFIAILVRQNRLLNDLTQLGEEKRRIIILAEVEQLDKLMQKEGIIVSNLEKLEGARFKLQEQLAQAWKMPVQDLTANVILGKIKASFPAYKEEVQTEIDNLKKIMSKLKRINTENNGLLDMTLDYIKDMQALLDGDLAGTYSNRGQQVDETSSRPKKQILDKKA